MTREPAAAPGNSEARLEQAFKLGAKLAEDIALKLPYLALQFSEPALAAMRAVKQALDPNGLLNPGNVI